MNKFKNCRIKYILSIIFCFVFVFALSLSAKSSLKIDSLNSDNYPEIKLKITLSDEQKALTGMKKDDFIIKENDAISNIKEVEELTVPSQPVGNKAVVINIDTSLSVKNDFEQMKNDIKTFIKSLSADDKIGLVNIGMIDKPVLELTDDKNKAIKTVEALKVESIKTVLRDSVFTANKLLSTADSNTRKMILLVSDGEDDGSVVTEDDVIQKAKGFKYPVHSWGYISPATHDFIRRIAKVTDGMYFYKPDSSQIKIISGAQSPQIAQYEITYTSPGTMKKGEESKVSVTVIPQEKEAFSSSTKYKIPESKSEIPITFILIVGLGLIVVIIPVIILLNKKKKPVPVSKQPPGLFNSQNNSVISTEERNLIEHPAAEPNKEEKPEPESDEDIFILNKQGRKFSGMLTIQNGDYKGETFLLNKRNIKIGKKSSACDIVLKGSDIVSREHAKINFKKNSFLLLDLGSSNGTLLNNYKIEQPEKLEHGDKIEIGDIILEFSLKER